MTSRLTFYPKSHRYKLDGTWVPGVTTLIGDGLPKKALMYWSARTVAEWVADNPEGVEQLRQMGRGPMVQALKETPWQKRDDAAHRGTIVHAIAEKVARGEQVEVDDIHAGYVEAAISFLDDFDATVLLAEHPCYHAEHRWAGTFDLIARVGDETWLIDWKSGDSGIWPETSLQLAAYAHATHYQDADGDDQPMPAIDRCVAVHLQPNSYIPFDMRADEWVYTRFRHIALVAAVGKSMKDERDSWMREVAPAAQDGAA